MARDIRRWHRRLRGRMEAAQEALALAVSPEGTLRLREEVRTLREELDLVKSSLDTPAELADEFAAWKARTPVPARPLVSVCIATWNRARLLTERCLPSVLGQTYPELEVIVVADGCTDDTRDRVALVRDPRLRLVELPERGRYPEDPRRRWMVAGTAAMNHALGLARGDYITHIDDDDEFLPRRLEAALAVGREQQADVVWHPFWYERTPGDWELQPALTFERGRVTASTVIYRSWFARLPWDVNAHRLLEPGDWQRLRRIKYLAPAMARCPEPLLRKFLGDQPGSPPWSGA